MQLAVDLNTGNEVAIKFIKRGSNMQAKSILRLGQEMAGAARLSSCMRASMLTARTKLQQVDKWEWVHRTSARNTSALHRCGLRPVYQPDIQLTVLCFCRAGSC